MNTSYSTSFESLKSIEQHVDDRLLWVTDKRLFKGHFVASYPQERQTVQSKENIATKPTRFFSLNPYRNLLETIDNAQRKENLSNTSSLSEKTVKESIRYGLSKEKSINDIFINENSTTLWFLRYFPQVPSFTEAWVFPATRPPSGFHSQVETLSESRATLRLSSNPKSDQVSRSQGATAVGHPTLRLRQNDQPPHGLKTSTIHSLPSRSSGNKQSLEYLIEKGLVLRMQRDEQIAKHGQSTPEYDRVQTLLQPIADAYEKNHKTLCRSRFMNVHARAIDALNTEGSVTFDYLKKILFELVSLEPEIDLFFRKGVQSSFHSILKQVKDATDRASSQDDAKRVKEWIDKNKKIDPSTLKSKDVTQLKYLYQYLKAALQNHTDNYKLPSLSKEDKKILKENIIKILVKLSSIATIFSSIIRHDRDRQFNKDQCSPRLLQEIQETINSGNRTIKQQTDPKTNKRIDELERLSIPKCNRDALLDMNDQDFELIIKILSGEKTSEQDIETMGENGWQLADTGNLVAQNDHERVSVIAINDSRFLIDTASNTVIGNLNPLQWQRIHERLEREGHSNTNAVTRQMIMDDLMNNPLTEEQMKLQHPNYNFLQAAKEENAEVVIQPFYPPFTTLPIVPDLCGVPKRREVPKK